MVFRSEGDDAARRAEVKRLAEEMAQLAADNSWSGVRRTYEKIEGLGDDAFNLAIDPVSLHLQAAQAARHLGETRRYKSLSQRAKASLLEAGRSPDDPVLQAVEAELAQIEELYGSVRITPRSKPTAKAAKGEDIGPELIPKEMPFGGDLRASIERARDEISKSGEFSGMLPKGSYTLDGLSFEVIHGTNIEVLWGDKGR
jgi:hypothetical protein